MKYITGSHPVSVLVLGAQIVEQSYSRGDYRGVWTVEQTHETTQCLPRSYEVAGVEVGAGIAGRYERLES